MTTQSIIVYRSPIEAAFYESNLLIPIGGGLIAFFLVVVVLGMALNKYYWHATQEWMTWVIFALAAVAGVAVYQYLVI